MTKEETIYCPKCKLEAPVAGFDKENNICELCKPLDEMPKERTDHKIHELKTWPEYYRLMDKRLKSFEVRKSDRDFKIGDFLYLREWSPETKEYSGEGIVVFVSYILHGGNFGIEDGNCVMSTMSILAARELEFLTRENQLLIEEEIIRISLIDRKDKK